MKVMVLGCGPSGLAAALAARNLGHEVAIASKRWEPSRLYGCQYLHAPIPGYEDVEKTRVQYSLIGTPEEYRNKVYGDKWQGRVSPEDFIGEHDAWDIRETYRRMWRDLTVQYQGPRFLMEISNGNLGMISATGVDKVISTIPATALCSKEYAFSDPHTFTSHGIFATGTTEKDGLKGIDNVMCNGTDDMDWYRVSNVFGYRTVEWSKDPGKYVPEAVKVTKPLSTNCNCHPNVIRAGRYGEWNKGVLVHQVYEKVTEVLSS